MEYFSGFVNGLKVPWNYGIKRRKRKGRFEKINLLKYIGKMLEQKKMSKKSWWLFLGFSLVFSGCSVAGKPDGGLYKSTDGGTTFSQKTKAGETATLANQAVLALEIDPQNSQVIYLGTDQLGILRSADGGENWAIDSGGYNTVTAVAVSRQSSDVIYFAGKKGNRGKVFKSINGGGEWVEIYTEKSDGTIVTALSLDEKDDQKILMGNSGGGIFKSEDGGKTWGNLFWSKSGISKIIRDPFQAGTFFFGTLSSGAWITENSGDSFAEIVKADAINNLAVDPGKEGRIFLSNKKGLSVSDDRGKTWQIMKTLTKPEEINSRGLAVDRTNGRIFYSSGKTLYQSSDEGKTWSTTQFNITRSMDVIIPDTKDRNNILVGVGRAKGQFNLFPF